MPVKPDPLVTEELTAMDLTLWSAIHPKVHLPNVKTGKLTPREDKSRVIATIAGPGVPERFGSGSTLREAVDDALCYARVLDRVPGVRGAVLRLEIALRDLTHKVRFATYAEGVDDDDIPF